ncbi:unknown [Haloarcula marismortui ATCC 43049]|uniref:Uncharacterized protein n=3 Tax=Haloarcula marismortui TaxID=2238 RepID=Q5V215_HALMA|nr:unknown [Haloarcula marismortui ATCC 43049]
MFSGDFRSPGWPTSPPHSTHIPMSLSQWRSQTSRPHLSQVWSTSGRSQISHSPATLMVVGSIADRLNLWRCDPERVANPTPGQSLLLATKYFPVAIPLYSMLPLLQLGSLPSLPALLVGLLAIAVVLLVGRLVMKVAWRLVIIAIIAVAVLWILGILGFQVI